MKSNFGGSDSYLWSRDHMLLSEGSKSFLQHPVHVLYTAGFWFGHGLIIRYGNHYPPQATAVNDDVSQHFGGTYGCESIFLFCLLLLFVGQVLDVSVHWLPQTHRGSIMSRWMLFLLWTLPFLSVTSIDESGIVGWLSVVSTVSFCMCTCLSWNKGNDN